MKQPPPAGDVEWDKIEDFREQIKTRKETYENHTDPGYSVDASITGFH